MSEKVTIGPNAIRTLTWVAFYKRFLECYFLEEKKDQKEKEFLELNQVNMTIQEYVTHFERLSRFAYHMVDIL